MRIESGGALANLAQGVQRQNTAAERSPEEMRDGLQVSLSELGQSLSVKTDQNRDIDESGLPETIKQLLKMIRQLKAQIAEKRAQLQALMTQEELDSETRRVRAQALQAELTTLNGALATANANLIKLMRENGLSSEQMMAASRLAMS